MIGTNFSALSKGIQGVVPNQNMSSATQDYTQLRGILGATVRMGLVASNKQKAAAPRTTNREPAPGEWCNALGGVYIKVTSTGAGSVIKIQHPLKKTPQGIVWVKQPASQAFLVLDPDDNGGTISDSEWAYVKMTGTSGDVAVGVLI